MPITRTPIIDDSGSGRDGTVIDNAWKQEFYNQIDAQAAAAATAPLSTLVLGTLVNIPAFTGPVSDWNPAGSADKIVWYLNNTAAGQYITGIAAAPLGTLHWIVNGGQPVIFSNAHPGSAAANRFICPGYGDYTLNSWYAVPILYSLYGAWVVLKAS
jgi:hypothetical protein